MEHILSYIVFIPLVGALVVLLTPKAYQHLYKVLVIGSTGLSLLLTLYAVHMFDGGLVPQISGEANLQLVEKVEWFRLSLGSLGTFSVDYLLAADGLNISMLLLASIARCCRHR